jgi:Fe2+ transport system protein FeoA
MTLGKRFSSRLQAVPRQNGPTPPDRREGNSAGVQVAYAKRSGGVSRLTLAAAPARLDLRVHLVSGDNGHAQRLRELGVYEGRTIQVLLKGNPLICRIGDCRFGLCHRLARHITVELVADSGASKRSA